MDERGKREHREISEDTVAVVQVGERTVPGLGQRPWQWLDDW